jgi:hypothetical protein
MSVSVVSPTLNAANPKCRLAIVASPIDLFWDDTNKRWNSGIVQSVIDSLTWTGTKTVGEIVNIVARPANYQPMCNNKTEVAPLATAAAWGGSFNHYTAVNYGVPDPSAAVESDGSLTLAYVDVELQPNSTSEIVVTLAHAPAVTSVDPYSDLTGTGYSLSVSLGSTAGDNQASWGQVIGDAIGSSDGYYVAQLNTLTTTYVGEGVAPSFVFSNAAQPSGSRIASLNLPIINGSSRPFTFKNSYTWCFAVNAGKLDANASPIFPSDGFAYNLANYGLVADSMNSDAVATATLNYTLYGTTF